MFKEMKQPVSRRNGVRPFPASSGFVSRHHPATGVWIYQADCLKLLDAMAVRHPEGCFDAIFADPPYFLSNGGNSYDHGGIQRHCMHAEGLAGNTSYHSR